MRPSLHHLRAHRGSSLVGGQAVGGAPALRPGQADRRAAGGDQEPSGDRRAARRGGPQVEEALREAGSEPTSEQIGIAVLERLRVLDDVAYLRFASVYKGFEGLGDFHREVGLLTKTTAPKRTRASTVAESARRRAGRRAGHLRPSGRSRRLLRGHAGGLGQGRMRRAGGALHRRGQGHGRPRVAPTSLPPGRAAETAEAGGGARGRRAVLAQLPRRRADRQRRVP